MKTCNECKHVRPASYDDPTGGGSRCEAPQAYDDINLVTGEKHRSLSFCQTLRSYPDVKFLWRTSKPPGCCGISGHWFEPKASD